MNMAVMPANNALWQNGDPSIILLRKKVAALQLLVNLATVEDSCMARNRMSFLVSRSHVIQHLGAAQWKVWQC